MSSLLRITGAITRKFKANGLVLRRYAHASLMLDIYCGDQALV